MKLNFDEMYALYPEPTTLYLSRNQTQECYCVLGIVCDYAKKVLGIAEPVDGHFPSPYSGVPFLRRLNKALSYDQAFQVAQCITRQNDERKFDMAKATLVTAMAHKKGHVLQLEAAPVFVKPEVKVEKPVEAVVAPKKPRKKRTKPAPPPESGDNTAEALSALLDMTF